MPAYGFSIAADTKSGALDEQRLLAELSSSSIATAVSGIARKGDGTFDVRFVNTLTTAEVTTLTGDANPPTAGSVIGAHDVGGLSDRKRAKLKDIDKRTGELIGEGFSFAGKTFSMSLEAQAKMTGTHQVRDDPALVYPINWNTLDDEGTFAIDSSTTLDGFYLTGLGTMRAHLDSGTVLKGDVRAATDQAGIDAVVDSR